MFSKIQITAFTGLEEGDNKQLIQGLLSFNEDLFQGQLFEGGFDLEMVIKRDQILEITSILNSLVGSFNLEVEVL